MQKYGIFDTQLFPQHMKYLEHKKTVLKYFPMNVTKN